MCAANEVDLARSPNAENARSSARIPRREPTENERRGARVNAEKIRGLRSNGLSPAKIGSVLRLPVGAVEEVLAAGASGSSNGGGFPTSPGSPSLPRTSSTPEASSEDAARFRGEQPAESQASPGWGFGQEPARFQPQERVVGQLDPLTADLVRILRLAGANANQAAIIAETFAFENPGDYNALEKVMLDNGASPVTARAVLALYKKRTMPPSSSTDDEDDEEDEEEREARRQERRDERERARKRQRQLDELEQEARIAKMNAETRALLNPPRDGGGSTPELQAALGKVAELERRLELTRLDDAHRKEMAEFRESTAAQIASLKSTREPPAVEAERNANAGKAKATEVVLSTADGVLKSRPVKELLEETGAIKIAGEILKKNVREPGSEEAGAKQPAPEEVARLAAVIEAEERAHGAMEGAPGAEYRPPVGAEIRPPGRRISVPVRQGFRQPVEPSDEQVPAER